MTLIAPGSSFSCASYFNNHYLFERVDVRMSSDNFPAFHKQGGFLSWLR